VFLFDNALNAVVATRHYCLATVSGSSYVSKRNTKL